MNKKRCYVCGSDKYRLRPGQVRDNGRLKILECSSCGLVYLSDSRHINERYYADSGMHGPGGERPLPEVWLKESEADDERRYVFSRHMLRNKVLLDFGCGAGGFLLKARKSCRKTYGIEPETRLRNHFRRNRLEVSQDIAGLLRNHGSIKFDCVTLFHVLEHLPDPRQTLRELGMLLSTKGKILIEVPHANDALLSLYESKAFSRFTYWSCHLYLFNEEALKRLIEQAGFSVRYLRQVQRYPLSNHLYWLSKGKPGGHVNWHFLDSPTLRSAYEKQLSAAGYCDTLMACINTRT